MGSRQSFGVSGLELGIRGFGISDSDLLEVSNLELRIWNLGIWEFVELWSLGLWNAGFRKFGIWSLETLAS